MVDFRDVSRDDVLAAMAEYDGVGADDFLALHGFGRAREYVLWFDGRSYDSKAILGVAYRRATGRPLSSDDFSGGMHGAAPVLRDLGFEVTGPELPADPNDLPETGNWRSVADVGGASARALWAGAARTLLLETARNYHSVITYKELADGVQYRTGIRTNQLLQHWIGDVLLRVAKECASRGEPNLSSLCVNASGSVGDGYRGAVVATTGAAPGDPDDHAAHVRLDCYRHFGAPNLPADGGIAALSPRLVRTRSRTRKRSQDTRIAATCPSCHMALPATNLCDRCD